MTENTNAATSENQLPAVTNRRAAGGWTGRLTVLALAVVVTFNIWLLASQYRTISEHSRERAFWALCHAGTAPAQRADYFLQLAAAGNTEWKSALLGNLNLQGVNLSEAQIESALFSACQFADADFSDAVLNKSGLDTSDFSRARFVGAELRNATFFKSVLAEADFRTADMLSVSLEQAKSQNAVFVMAKMGDAHLAMADLTGANFTSADLSGANLEAAILKNADLALANLYDARLEDTDFTDSNWWRASGLSSPQLDRLTLEFPPTSLSSDSRQRDFEIWLQKRIEDYDRRNPR